MKTISSHGRTDQIIINEDIDHYAETFFTKVKERLKESYVFHTEQDGRTLTFKGSIFRFVWNGWDVFNNITHGKIRFLTIDGEPYIEHKVNFNEALVIALLFTIIPIFTLKFEPQLSLLVFIIIWLLYGVNYLIAIYRFNSYISSTLIEVNKLAAYDLEEDFEETKEEALA
jgi:hypothetical protein